MVHRDATSTLTTSELAADLGASGLRDDEHQLAAAVLARLAELGDLDAAEALSAVLATPPPRQPRRAP